MGPDCSVGSLLHVFGRPTVLPGHLLPARPNGRLANVEQPGVQNRSQVDVAPHRLRRVDGFTAACS